MWALLAMLVTGAGWAADESLTDSLVLSLSHRDAGPPCADFGESDAVTEALVAIADTVQAPPWVPMRAAKCVADRVGDTEIAQQAARRWLVDPATPGLAVVVVTVVPELEPELSKSLRDLAEDRAAVDQRFEMYARKHLDRLPENSASD